MENPRAYLLADLGRATRLWPGLEAALAGPHPSEVILDTAGGQRFLGDAAPLLEQAGFGILVPPWWKQRTRLGLRLRARPRPVTASADGTGIGLAGLCDYRFEIAVGDATLTVKELRHLAELKAPLVRVRGQWVELRAGDVERALAVLTGPRRPARSNAAADDAAAGAMTAGEVLRIGLGLAPPPSAELPVVEVVAEGWLGALLGSDVDGDGADRGIEPRKTPAGFDGTLRPYQERGLAWLWFLHRSWPRRLPGRRHGPGQDRPAAGPHGGRTGRRRSGDDRGHGPATATAAGPDPARLPDVAGRQLATGDGPLRPRPRRPRPPRHRTAPRPALAAAAGRADLVITTYSLLARDRDLLARSPGAASPSTRPRT